MSSYSDHSATLVRVLSLKTEPVAVRFSTTPPAGVAHVETAAPAGCAYWKRAATGEVFYTEQSDHLGCAIGAYTHGATLGAVEQQQLGDTLTMMTGAAYLDMSEVPNIPVVRQSWSYITYAPLGRAPEPPDLVLVRGSAKSAMLLSEAEHAADARDPGAPVMRPACAMVPQVLGSGRATTSLGCIGNRVYTGLPDDEMWHAIPGARLDAVVGKLLIVAHANDQLAKFHEARVSGN
jgi:uncharacterized protein (DUF169 family)